MSDTNNPKIITFKEKLGEFYFLGFAQAVTPETDFEQVWGNYFDAVGAAGLDGEYDRIVWYGKDKVQFYFVGKVADSASVVPEGFSLVKFPACEYLVVTHEWLDNEEDMCTIGNAATQDYAGIGQTHAYKADLPMPDGYVRYDDPDSPITQIENENRTEGKCRFERWIPIKKM